MILCLISEVKDRKAHTWDCVSSSDIHIRGNGETQVIKTLSA